jgi:hypothetical protein
MSYVWVGARMTYSVLSCYYEGMDAAANNQQQDPSANPLLAQQASPPQGDAQPVLIPPQPVSGPNKEFVPLAKPADTQVQEIIQPTETEPSVPLELQELGVEAQSSPEQPKISQEVQKVTGITPAKDAVPVPTTPSNMVQLPSFPMNGEQAENAIKTHPVSDSIRWLASLIIEQTKRAQRQVIGK